MGINIDDSVFVRGSINEVIHALVIALVLVLVVIYLFLGTVRATLIPAVTIPVSIIAASIVMVIAGFSINVLTLLGAVLAIGLVVDDAIVVLENIVRRIEHGEPPLLAAVDGSREIGFAVVATTMVLIAVFLPISFIPGNIGRLFGEFGITIAAAVGFSALVSLTLAPMMSSKIFGHGIVRGRVAHAVDRFFRWLSQAYERSLRNEPARSGADRRRRRGGHRCSRWSCSGCCRPNTRRPKTAQRVHHHAHRARRREPAVHGALPEAGRADRRSAEVEKGNARAHAVAHRQFRRRRRGQHRPRRAVAVGLRRAQGIGAADRAAHAPAAARTCPACARSVVTPGGLGIRGSGPPVQIVLGGGDYAELARWRDIILRKRRRIPA